MAGKGLDLVGMMVDRAEVEPGRKGEGQEGKIVLHRKSEVRQTSYQHPVDVLCNSGTSCSARTRECAKHPVWL